MALSRGFEPSLATGTLLATSGGAPIVPFLSTWNTAQAGTSNSQQIQLPLVNGGDYDFEVDWGDGNSNTITEWDSAAKTHTYNSSGNYTVNIVGTINGWMFNNTDDKLKLSNVEQWGCLQPGNTGNAFYGCTNLTSNAADSMNTTGTTNMASMFRSCPAFNGDVSGWDMGSTTNTAHMFRDCSTFNSDLSAWNVSSVTDFSHMLRNCVDFDKDVSSWNTTSATSLSSLFYGCTVFNQDVSGWETANVTLMPATFRLCPAFNQDVSSWNTANVTSMLYMFRASTSFDQNLGTWNVASLTNANGMFQDSQISTTNWSALLIGWDAQTVQFDVDLHGGTSTYNAAGGTARTNLVNDDSWNITDGGAA
jgi:surface protein